MSERGMRRSASPFLTIPKSMQWSRCMYTPGTEGGTGVKAEGGAVGGGGARKRGECRGMKKKSQLEHSLPYC